MNSYINLFLEDMKKRGKAPSTISAYKKDLNSFYSYLDKNKLLKIERINKTNIISYLFELRKQGKSNSTMNRALCVLRSFFKFLHYNSIIKIDPTIAVEIPKAEEKKLKIISTNDIEKLISSIPTDTSRGVRDKAMLILMYETGIRVSEIINLSLSDYNSQLKILTIRKGKKIRFLPLNQACENILNTYIENERNKLKKDKSTDYLFLNQNGELMSRQGFWKNLKAYSKKADLKIEITPQSFRHCFVKHCLEKGMTSDKILELLGTNDISSLALYKD